MKVAVIGGGAAGFFAALSAKRHHSEAQVEILEKSDKILIKVEDVMSCILVLRPVT